MDANGREGRPGSCLTEGDEARQDSVLRVMAAASEAFAGWFRAMRSCIGRGREAQEEARRAEGLPKSAKVAYSATPPDPSESASASLAESVTRALFGDAPADYAREKFERALRTGDMRAFKIRLLFIKARDALAASGSPAKSLFARYMDYFITKSEELAGCIPDPSPRRRSRQGKEKAREEGSDSAHDSGAIVCAPPCLEQQELPLEWPETGLENDPPIETDSKEEETQGPHAAQSENSGSRVTVTNILNCRFETVDQVVDGIADGEIDAYDSAEDLCEDVRSGKISVVDALMMAAAMHSFNDEDMDRCEPNDAEDVSYDEDLDEGDENDGGADDEYGDDTEDDACDMAPGYSYNPRGFGCCGGAYASSGAEWAPDDNW